MQMGRMGAEEPSMAFRPDLLVPETLIRVRSVVETWPSVRRP